jgi:hypothetical protein
LRRRRDQSITALPRRLGENIAVDQPQSVAIAEPSIIRQPDQNRPARRHLFIDQFPHRLRLSDMRVGIDYTLHVPLLLLRTIFLHGIQRRLRALQSSLPVAQARVLRAILNPLSSIHSLAKTVWTFHRP